MRTTAGTYASQTIKTRTLTLADTSGISVCFGSIDSPDLLDEAKEALTQMKARWSNRIQIETTHFVCTHPSGPAPAVTPPSDSPQEALDPGVAYQRASQLSIPIVQPAWILACLREKRMVPISAYTLDKATISGGPSSSVSLGKNTSSRSQHAPAQQPRNWPREPIQLQKPPPPKNSPDAAASPLPANEVAQQADTEIAPLPTSVQLAPTALSEGEPSAIEATKVESAEVAAADAESEPDPAEVGSAHPESTKVEDELQTTKSEAQAGSDSASQALSDKQISQLDDISISHAEEQGEETVVGVAEDSSSSKQADGAMPEAQQTDEPATELQNLGQDEGEDIDESSAVNTASETQEVTGLPEVTTPSDETSATAESTDSKDHQTPANDALEESPESKEENGKEEDASSDELEEVKL